MKISWSEIWLIFSKELRDLLKDRMIIILTVVLPILTYPLLLTGMSKLQSIQEKKLSEKVIKVAITGESEWLTPFLKQSKETLSIIKNPDDPLASLKDGKIHAWIDLTHAQDAAPALVVINYSAADDISNRASRSIKELLVKAKKVFMIKRLSDFGRYTAIHDIVETVEIDQSSDRKKSGYLVGKILPFLMILMILSGASFAAIDLISGEKERGTLETLLVAPVERQSIIWGKFLVVVIIGFMAAIINLIGILASFTLKIANIPMSENLNFVFNFTDFLVILVLSLPMAVFFSALLMILASYADSFKEGQYYVTPLLLISIIPAVASLLPGIQLNSLICIVPIASLAVATREVLTGTYHWWGLALAFLSNIFYAGLALRFAAIILDKEHILIDSKKPQMMKSPHLVKEGILLYASVWLLFYFVGTVIQQMHLIIGLWVSELAFIAGPAVLFLWWYKQPIRTTLKLQRFNPLQFFGALCLQGATFLFIFRFMEWQNYFLPVPKSLAETFSGLLSDSSYPHWLLVLTFSVSAGLCEETLFRGALTTLFIRSMSRWRTLVLVSILFGFLHFNIYRFFPTAIIGFVLTYVFLKMNSLYPVMILHALHNAAAVLLPYEGVMKVTRFSAHPLGIITMCALAILGWAILKMAENHKNANRVNDGEET